MYYEAHHTEQERLGSSALEEIRGPLFAEWIGSGKQILDVGCRDGTLTKWFQKGNTVCGIDIDQRALCLYQKSPNSSGILGDINEPLPVRNESFDVVVLGEVIEHLLFPSEVLAESYRVLKPGGLLLGSVPNGFHLRKRLRFLMGKAPEPESVHFHTFSATSLRPCLESKFFVQDLLSLGGRYYWVSPRLLCHHFIWRCYKRA